jgi:thioesterase domain-containing protein/acyl carrier protein
LISQRRRKLTEIWCRILGLDNIGPRDDFFRLGGDSLASAELLVEIERTFGQRIAPSALFEASTVEALTLAISQQAPEPSWSPLVELQPEGSRPPFFCVHGVGGEVLSLRDLARYCAPDQPFFGLRAVGSDGDQAPLKSIADMAAIYVETIRAVQPKPPYYLGGFSFGGSVALEMAQQLLGQGKEVAFLGIFDHTPPPLRYRRVTWSVGLPAELLTNTLRWLAEDVWRAGRGNRWSTLRKKLVVARKQVRNFLRPRSAGNARTDVEDVFGAERLPDYFRHVIEAHYQALREYTPRKYPGRVTLFRAQTRPLFRLHGRDLGWSKLAQGGLDIVQIPGNHNTLMREPRVGVLAKSLVEHLRKAQADS